jgi:hypothetical protein
MVENSIRTSFENSPAGQFPPMVLCYSNDPREMQRELGIDFYGDKLEQDIEDLNSNYSQTSRRLSSSRTD